jgi:hypothetical protein
MSGEIPAADPALIDIERIFRAGLLAFLDEQQNAEEGSYRIRRAYDSAWRHVYAAAFPEPYPAAAKEPAQAVIDSFDRIWDLTDDPQFRQYAEFASFGNWSRDETNEIEALFENGAQYFFETKFSEDVQALCDQGGITGSGTYETPAQTAAVLRNFMTTTFLTWLLMPGDNMSVDEARLGIRTIVLGPTAANNN